jgi:PadR family transcriptional regulator, regulatory protein PadR
MPRRPNTSPQAIAVFSALLERTDQWRHGYDIMQATGMKSGTLYPLLIRLHESGLLETEWTTPDGVGRGPRHVYRLTHEGTIFARCAIADAAAKATTPPAKLKPLGASS